MKKRYTEEQIIGFLRDGEAGIAVKDLCRKHGFSEASHYLWKSKFGGMSVVDGKRLRELETKNTRLKKLLAGPGHVGISVSKAVKDFPTVKRPRCYRSTSLEIDFANVESCSS